MALYKQLPSPVVLTATSPVEITSFGIKTCDNSSVGRCDFTSFSAGIFNDWEKSCFTVQCRHLKLPFQAVQNWQIQTFFCQCVCACIRTSLSFFGLIKPITRGVMIKITDDPDSASKHISSAFKTKSCLYLFE